ncbi:MAG TPA: creatininase family protein [Stellaceae bacterium]|nr:creatininase family protein [Stellaceae bacterium]
MRGAWLEDLTWPEVEARLKAGALVFVPVGAIAKEHGHHLPMRTDWLVARELARRVAAALPVLVAPIVSHGYYPAFTRYPGSQHLSAETFAAVMRELLSKLIADGARRIAVVNTGVSTEEPLQIVVRDLLASTGMRIAVADMRQLGIQVLASGSQKLGGHGDEWETSMVLAIEPSLVHMDRAVEDYGNMLGEPKTVFRRPVRFSGDPADGPDYSRSGVRGDPTLATAEKGRTLLAEMARELIEGLVALYPDLKG